MLCMAVGDIGKRIRMARETFRGVGMKQNDLAARIGISRARLSNWENGLHDPSPFAILNQIAQVLEIDVSYLRDGGDAPPAPKAIESPLKRLAPASGKIKVYGAVSAGVGNTGPYDESKIDVPIEFARDDYGAMVIEGDSMMPNLMPSDLAIFRDWYIEKVNQVVVAVVGDSDWVVKLMVYDQGAFRLRSFNPAYQDITSNFQVRGFLVGLIRDVGNERVIRLNPYGLQFA